MLISLVYFLVRRVLGAGGRHQVAMDIELLVLRHQVKVLQRHVRRPRLKRLDRVLFAAASTWLPRGSWSSFMVRPDTLLRWHRELVRRKWTFRRTGHQETWMADDHLVAQAQANPIENFRLVFQPQFLKSIVGRMDDNEDIFKARRRRPGLPGRGDEPLPCSGISTAPIGQPAEHAISPLTVSRQSAYRIQSDALA